MDTKLDVTGTRSILSSLDEYRMAVAEIAKHAHRSLSIYTPNLEPLLYDQDSFLEPLKRLVLARGHARLRVLISDPARVVREGNRFMQMARRLTSFIELRNVPPEFRDNPAAFIIAFARSMLRGPSSGPSPSVVAIGVPGVNTRRTPIASSWGLKDPKP